MKNNINSKLKLNFEKRDFYVLLGLCTLITVSLLFWVLSTFIDNELIKNTTAQEIQNIKVAKLLSYIGNSLVIVFFCLYAYFLRYKVKAGYIFFIFWSIIFISMAFLPFITNFKTLNIMQKIFGSFATIFASIITIYLIVYIGKLFVKRKVHKYELIQNVKGKRR